MNKLFLVHFGKHYLKPLLNIFCLQKTKQSTQYKFIIEVCHSNVFFFFFSLYFLFKYLTTIHLTLQFKFKLNKA